MASAPAALVASPRRPGDPANPMPWRAFLGVKPLWSAFASLVGIGTGAVGLAAARDADGSSSAVLPLVVVVAMRMAVDGVLFVLWAYRSWRQTLRTERVADAQADEKGLLGQVAKAKDELAEAVRQVANRDLRIAELQRDHKEILGSKEATLTFQRDVIEDLRKEVRILHEQNQDLLNQLSSMGETVNSIAVSTEVTREAAEETKAAVLPTTDPATRAE